MAVRDLAEQVLATGYRTKSKDFTDVVWTPLANWRASRTSRARAGA